MGRVPRWQRTDSFCPIPYKDYEHVCIWQTKRKGATLQKAVFRCNNENSDLSEHACKPTLRFGGVIPKLSAYSVLREQQHTFDVGMYDNKSGDLTRDFGERGFEGDDYLGKICPV